jgi:hypothetical protein
MIENNIFSRKTPVFQGLQQYSKENWNTSFPGIPAYRRANTFLNREEHKRGLTIYFRMKLL